MAKTKSYGQFCPVAQAAEVIAERWTPLVLRELLCGSRRFSDLRRGVPHMSPSLLSQRLKELADAGVVARVPAKTGSGAEYVLTPAGEELRPVIELLGLWGHRWLRRDLRREELDPALLMWDVRRCVIPMSQSAPRTVVRFELRGVPHNHSRWWLVFDRGEVDLCLKDPGHEVDLTVTSHIRALVDVWLGRLALREAVRAGTVQLVGARAVARGFKDWFALGTFTRLAATTPPEAPAARTAAR